MVVAFDQAGDRAAQCLESEAIDQSSASAADLLRELRAQWVVLEPKMHHDAIRADSTTLDDAMDNVIRIEQVTEQLCGKAQGLDLALLLIGRNREGAER
jgi:hypothetical protein